ncbi:unnamed protein product [Ambrosiozyma monospora]|uniref:Unnamed protein product n=1 Tax=Ambrosiozyma monospora TaxID=43982 RepID=A0ACB5T8N7_AMBMO|nr:unnamed protein product [Ambrosiozyma monospora]
MDRSLALGLEAVRKITKSLGLTGVYGSLGELIDVSEKYKTAVEVVGGNSLFHVVVDNDQTASLIMDELIRTKAGRVTFMPLNRLHPQPVTYPSGSDSVPLIKKIAFDDYLAPAVNQVFAKTVVCISLERGAEIARTNNVNAITLDGDRCDKKGVLTGGYRDQTRSRVDFLRNLTKWKSEIIGTTEKLGDIRKQITEKDNEITQMTDVLNTKRKQLDAVYGEKEGFMSAKAKIANEKSRYQEEIGSLDSRVTQLESAIVMMEKQIFDYSEELKSDFSASALSDKEEAYVRQLTNEIPELESQYGKTVEELEKLSLTVSSLSSELNENLYPKLSQLNIKSISSGSADSTNFKIQDIKRKLHTLNQSKTSIDRANEALLEKTTAIEKDLAEKHQQLEKLYESQRSTTRKLENFSKTSEKSLGKKISLSSRREEVNKKIGDLGVLPDAAFTAYNITLTRKLWNNS